VVNYVGIFKIKELGKKSL